MTVPVSVSLPSPSRGKTATATSAVPGGKSQGLDGAAAEASGVADMFAALVATLTAQMQPTAGDAAATADAVVPEVPAATAEGLAAGFAPGPQVTATPLGAAVTATEGEMPVDGEIVLEGDTAPVAVAAGAQGEVADLVDGAESADADDVRTGRRAVPAQPAVPASREGDQKISAQPAVPAQPASQSADEPKAGPVLPEQAAPAAQAATAVVGQTPVAAAPATPPAAESAGENAAAPNVNPASATPAAARAEAPAPVAPAAPAAPADAHVQVARVVRPLRLSNDGAYELALDLTPAELGRVRIDVELRGATIHLNLRADNPATRELLQDSLQQLRRELETAGLQAGNLDVGGRGPDSRGAPERDNQPGAFASIGADDDLVPAGPAAAAPTDTLTDDTVDVRA